MRSAVATRSSLPPVATAIAWTASSSGRRPSGNLPVAPDSGVSVPPRSSLRPPTVRAGLADPAPTAGLADPATTDPAPTDPVPTDRETVALATRATPVAATSESAQTNQNRRSAARRGPSGTSAQRPSPAASSSGGPREREDLDPRSRRDLDERRAGRVQDEEEVGGPFQREREHPRRGAASQRGPVALEHALDDRWILGEQLGLAAQLSLCGVDEGPDGGDRVGDRDLVPLRPAPREPEPARHPDDEERHEHRGDASEARGPHGHVHRLASPSAAARTTTFIDSPRLRLRLARPHS